MTITSRRRWPWRPCAIADVIVSGDRHLLALGSWRDIPIVKPAEFPTGA